MKDIEIPKPKVARKFTKREQKRFEEVQRLNPKWWTLNYGRKVQRVEPKSGESFTQAFDRFMQDLRDRTPRTYKKFFTMLKEQEKRRIQMQKVADKKAKGRLKCLKRIRTLSTQQDYT